MYDFLLPVEVDDGVFFVFFMREALYSAMRSSTLASISGIPVNPGGSLTDLAFAFVFVLDLAETVVDFTF